MLLRKKTIFILLLVIVSTLLISCGRANQADPEEVAPDRKTVQRQGQQEGFGIQSAEGQSELAGGDEKDVRKPHPVSNNELQRKYPNLLFLHGSNKGNRVALSFDDGPDTRFTPQVLDVLAKHDVKATFFMMGSRATEHMQITKRVHDEGHAIGNHTYWHPNLSKEGVGRLEWEVRETERAISNIVAFGQNCFGHLMAR